MNRWKYVLVGLLVGAFAFPLVWNSDPSVIGQTVTVDSTQSPLVVNAVADLADLTPTDGQSVIIKTGAEKGLWYYDKDSATATGVSVLNGPGSVGRFLVINNDAGSVAAATAITAAEITDDSLLELQAFDGSTAKSLTLEELKKTGVQVVNVMQHGATGDGVADDTAEIQAAITAIGVNGGCLYLPTGVYLVSDTLTLPNGDYFTMMGNGNSSVIKSTITDGTALLDCNTAQHFTLRDFKIRAAGNGTPANFIGIDMTNANRWSIIDVTVHEATVGVEFTNSFIGAIHNLFIRYCTTGFTAEAFHDIRGSIKIENVSQGFTINGMLNSRVDILCEGAARTSSSTIDSMIASRMSCYFEDSSARSVPELAIGATTTCLASTIEFTGGAYSGTTGPFITVDKCDGLTLKGIYSTSGVYNTLTTTRNSKNLVTDIVDSTLTTSYPVPTQATLAQIRPVNFIPDALFHTAIPGSISDTRCTSSEEREIVPPFATRSLKVAGTVGQANNYATKTWTFATYTHMNELIGHKIGVGHWVYCNDASFYTHNSPGPDVYVVVGFTTGFTFTADAGTDVITAAGHGLADSTLVASPYFGTAMTVSSSTTLPDGLAPATTYFARDVTPSTFKLSASAGGAAIDILDAGTGTHTALPTAAYFATATRNQVFVKGKWVFIANEFRCAKSATSIAVSYYANRSGTVATSDTVAYFVGPVMWIGGLDNVNKIVNGDYTEHPDAL